MFNNCDAGTSKGFFDSVVGSEFATRPATPKKAAPKQSASSKPASAGFFDSAVGSEFGTRSETPTKAAPKQPASSNGASNGASSGMLLASHPNHEWQLHCRWLV